jgi:hypothetical protein
MHIHQPLFCGTQVFRNDLSYNTFNTQYTSATVLEMIYLLLLLPSAIQGTRSLQTIRNKTISNFFSNFIRTGSDRNLENPKNKYTLSNTMEAAICNQIYPWLGEPGNSFAFCNEFFLSQVFWGSKRLGTTPIHNYLIHSHLIHRHLIQKHLMQKHSNSTANHSDFF